MIFAAKFDLGLIKSQLKRRVRANDRLLSDALVFGLGAGLHFEYFIRPNESPTHFFTGHNRHLARELETHVETFDKGAEHDAIVTALRTNALAMNLDRAPTMGILGMELVADDFENWQTSSDWALCAGAAAREEYFWGQVLEVTASF
jgi:hypothetical protein